MNHSPDNQHGFAGRLASVFVESRLTIILIIASLLLGIVAVAMLPREEEPQIKVPMIDVMVAMPGATPKEVEERVSIPMEKLLYELPGVEYIYTTSMPGQCLLVARFYVGEKMEDAIVRLNQKLATNFDRIPYGVVPPMVKPHTIDDVPIMALTFHSAKYDHSTLRRLAAPFDHLLAELGPDGVIQLLGRLFLVLVVLLQDLLQPGGQERETAEDHVSGSSNRRSLSRYALLWAERDRLRSGPAGRDQFHPLRSRGKSRRDNRPRVGDRHQPYRSLDPAAD